MKRKYISLLTLALAMFGTTSCLDEFDPQGGNVTVDQAANAPNSYNNFVKGITTPLVGQRLYDGRTYDYGYPTTFLFRDVMGNDIALGTESSWYSAWYTCSVGLGPRYAICQMPWTYYYTWIKNCNTVLSMAGDNPAEDKIVGAGIAHSMRAMFYMDLAQMYAQKTYTLDKESHTVPIITEKTTPAMASNNPRATNEVMWNFIIEDLNKAEKELEGYKRIDKTTPDLSVVYGLKARAYLVMGNWAEAAKYAKLAQEGYSITTEDQYTSRLTGFNTPIDSWMFGVKFKDTDPAILGNDADDSWGSIMCLELKAPDGCGYASNYGHQLLIDRHLYETIPATDFRKNCFVDFAIDELKASEGKTAKENKIEALKKYSDVPEYVYNSGVGGEYGKLGGLSLKFRINGGDEFRENQYSAFLVAVPLMRVEEMKLIEAEATGMQDGKEAQGIALLTAFAKSRDPQYVYGKHDEAYGNIQTSAFQNEVWWQRRVELWGEGQSMFDIKRLNKGIIRSYNKTNHLETYRWNTSTPPDWMNFCIVQTETDNNPIENNPTPIAPESDSPEFVW